MYKKIYNYINKVEAIRKGEVVYPVTCEIDPSNVCNLNCSFCMFKDVRKGETLPWNTYCELLLDLKNVGVKSITFTGGGEPTLNPWLNDMVDLALESGMEVGLVTNGILLHGVSDLSRFSFIRVSLDAADEETYLAVKGADRFSEVMKNICLAAAFASGSTTVVGISYVVCKKNHKGVKTIHELGKSLGVDYVQVKPGWENGKVYDEYETEASPNIIKTERFTANSKLPCSIAQLIGVVGADGNVYYCCQQRGKAKYVIGSLHEQRFSKLWPQRKWIYPEIRHCPQCRYMNYAKEYEELGCSDLMFFRHRNFL